MIDIELIRRKLSRLNMYLEKLKPISQKSLEEYKTDFYLKSGYRAAYSINRRTYYRHK